MRRPALPETRTSRKGSYHGEQESPNVRWAQIGYLGDAIIPSTMFVDSAPGPSIWFDTPTFGVVRTGIARAFRWLSVALAVYAGSAAMASASVGLWLLALETSNRADPISGVFNLAGGITTLAAAFLALAALVLLLIACDKLRPSAQVVLGTTAPVLQWYRTALVFAFTLALLTSLSVVGWMFSRGPSIFGPVTLALSGATAIAFLAAVLLPLHSLVPQNRRAGLWVVAALSIAAIIAEAIVPMGAMSGHPPATNWMTLGGFPLLNWHLVFGAIVAACSAFLAWSYWGVAVELAARPRRSFTRPERVA